MVKEQTEGWDGHNETLAGISVLVTRPSPDGVALSASLADLGARTIEQPLIEFSLGRDKENLIPQLQQSGLVIAISKQAVQWAASMLESLQASWPSAATYYAIGQKTAQQLEAVVQQPVHYPVVSDSEHLLALPALQASAIADRENKQVLILRGNGGRELIYDRLVDRGAIVSYCEVYQRQRVRFNGDLLVSHWKESSISHIVVTSTEQLKYLNDGVPESAYPWLYQSILVVPSERIAHLAQQLGFYTVVVSASASNQDLIAALISSRKA